MTTVRNIIVIGASAGGFDAIQKLVGGLPKDLPAALFIVWHMSPEIKGILPYVLNKLGTLPAANAFDKEPIKEGRIYVAPPDWHMLIEANQIRINKGPKENRFRPAIDPLFRSAAEVFSTRVIGIVLSGALDDGTSGLWTVKNYGGIAIVQHPYDAAVSSMPESVLRSVEVDYCITMAEMPALLQKLCTRPESPRKKTAPEINGTTNLEIQIAKGEYLNEQQVFIPGELTPFSCPDCHGVLSSITEGTRKRYRCYTGHAYSATALINSIAEELHMHIENAIRNLEERKMLLNHLGDHFAEMNHTNQAAYYFQDALEANGEIQKLRDLLDKAIAPLH